MRLFGCARVAGLAGLITSPAVRQPAGEPAAPAPPLSHRDSRAQQEQCVQPAGTVRQPSQRFSSQPNRTYDENSKVRYFIKKCVEDEHMSKPYEAWSPTNRGASLPSCHIMS